MMQALGSEISLVPSQGGGVTEKLIKEMIETARAISSRPGHWWCDQLNNGDALQGYIPLGEEIWEQTAGRVNAFIHAVGTAHSIHGTTQGLWKHDRTIHVVAVEPEESAVLSGRPSGSHSIEGIGIGFIPPLWEPQQVNEVMPVSTREAKAMARRLASEEGIFAGTSSGANVVAAIRIAHRLGRGATVATIIVHLGPRYLSTDVFRPFSNLAGPTLCRKTRCGWHGWLGKGRAGDSPRNRGHRSACITSAERRRRLEWLFG